jgi:glycosyltransferase involved in cell wall biosynthesis
MDREKNERMKIVWLCSFENEELASLLGEDSSLMISPWITELIDLFRDRTDIELFIVAPNYFRNKSRKIKIGNIEVNLYQYRPSFLPKKAYNFTFNYPIARKAVASIIKKINPDLIHLHGSENPLYAVGVLSLMPKYPVLVNVQGFVFLSSKPRNLIRRYVRWNRIRIERNINRRAPSFIITTEEGSRTLRTFSEKAKIYKNYYPTIKPDVSSLDYPNKKYDLVYYARISKDKGIEDLIEAVKILKKSRPNISVIVIGGGTKPYLEYIKSLIEAYQLGENINLAGFQPSQQDVFKLAVQAKAYVLPTYFDNLPGSIREAMFMHLPVIAYAIGGIPDLNDDKACVTLVERLNIKELVEKIELVLDDKVRTDRLVKNAYEVITNKYDNGKIYSNLLDIYQDIINVNKT